VIRVVLAVALAAVLLGASLPAVDRARVAHTDAALEREGERLAAGIAALADRSGSGGRWIVTVRVPGRSWGHAGGRLSIADGIEWQVDGGRPGRARLPVPVVDGLVLRTPGRHRLVVELVRHRGRVGVAVRRLDLKSEGATTAAHAGSVRPRGRGV
jgi:hypothetical protein